MVHRRDIGRSGGNVDAVVVGDGPHPGGRDDLEAGMAQEGDADGAILITIARGGAPDPGLSIATGAHPAATASDGTPQDPRSRRHVRTIRRMHSLRFTIRHLILPGPRRLRPPCEH